MLSYRLSSFYNIFVLLLIVVSLLHQLFINKTDAFTMMLNSRLPVSSTAARLLVLTGKSSRCRTTGSTCFQQQQNNVYKQARQPYCYYYSTTSNSMISKIVTTSRTTRTVLRMIPLPMTNLCL